MDRDSADHQSIRSQSVPRVEFPTELSWTAAKATHTLAAVRSDVVADERIPVSGLTASDSQSSGKRQQRMQTGFD